MLEYSPELSSGHSSNPRISLQEDLGIRPLPYRSNPLSDMVLYLIQADRRFYGILRAEPNTIKDIPGDKTSTFPGHGNE